MYKEIQLARTSQIHLQCKFRRRCLGNEALALALDKEKDIEVLRKTDDEVRK